MPDAENQEPPERRGSPPREDLAFEIAFYERILKRLPDSVDVLMALGDNYTRCGLIEKGLTVDESLCRLRATDPIVHYNLACSYSLLGRTDEAIQTLEQAVTLGYHDFAHLQRDPDLDGIRRDPRYLALVDRVLRQHLTS